MKEREQKPEEGSALKKYNAFVAKQIERFDRMAKAWSNLEDPSEPKEIKDDKIPYDKEPDDPETEWFIASHANHNLGC